MPKPPKEIDGVKVGKLTSREKQLLKRMDEDDKHDALMARIDAASEKSGFIAWLTGRK